MLGVGFALRIASHRTDRCATLYVTDGLDSEGLLMVSPCDERLHLPDLQMASCWLTGPARSARNGRECPVLTL
jgi:hypothetical protein